MTTVISGGRYDETKIKDPFANLAYTYIPSEIKKAFQMAEQIYKSNILILRAIYKLAEYPITPLKYNALINPTDDDEPDDDLKLTGEEVENIYRQIFEEHLDFNKALIELNLNYYLYSNDFPMLHMPYERKAMCKECYEKAKKRIPDDSHNRDAEIRSIRESLEKPAGDFAELRWEKDKFKGKCPDCKGERELVSRDIPDRNNYSGVSIRRLNVHRLEIQELEFSGSRRYLYNASDMTKKNVKNNDLFTLCNEPMVVLKAIGAAKKVEYYPQAVFHFKMPSPTFERESPWAWPLLISAFQTIFFINTLRRAAEAIAQEHIQPKHYVAPAKELDTLLAKYDMADIKTMLQDAYEEAQMDDNRIAFLPLPVHPGILNQQGRAFLPQNEISQATRELLTGIGIAEGILTGQGPFAANSIAVRILENGFLSQRDMTQRFIDYAVSIVQEHFKLPPCQVAMTDFRKLDDSLHKQMVGNAVNQKRVSNRTFMRELGYDPEEEAAQVREETRKETEYQAEMEALLESKRAETQLTAQMAQAAKETENRISQLEQQTAHITTMVDGLLKKGYPKEWALNYVNQYMQQQTAFSEQQAAQARAQEAEMAFLRDRMANATTGLNRAENKLQMHQMMDQAVADPAMASLTYEQNAIGQVVQSIKLMNDDEAKQFLDEMQARNPVLHQQVTALLGTNPMQ